VEAQPGAAAPRLPLRFPFPNGARTDRRFPGSN
jgi:hypothetical protein